MKKAFKLLAIVMVALNIWMPAAQAVNVSYQEVESKYKLEYKDTFQVDHRSYDCFGTNYGDSDARVYAFFDDQKNLIQDDELLEKLAQLLILNGYNDQLANNLELASNAEKAYTSLRVHQSVSTINTLLGKAAGIIGTAIFSKGKIMADVEWYTEDVAWAFADAAASGEALENQALTKIKRDITDAKKKLEERGSNKQKNYNDAIQYIKASQTINEYAKPFEHFCIAVSPTSKGSYIEDALQSLMDFLDAATGTAADLAVGSVDDALSTIMSASDVLNSLQKRVNDIPALIKEVGLDTALYTQMIPSLACFCHAVETTQNQFEDSIKNAPLRIVEQCAEIQSPQKVFKESAAELEDVNWPDKLSVGQAYSVYGVINLPPATSLVAIGVYNGSQMVTGATTKQPSSPYSVHSVDNDIRFDHLDSGTYDYKIIITDENGHEQVLLDKRFEVVDSGSMASVNSNVASETNRITMCAAYIELPKRVINLYSSPTDADRLTYFDYGPTVRCDGYQFVDGRKFYSGYVNHKGVDMALWFAQEDDMVVDVRHSYNSAGICECGATLH